MVLNKTISFRAAMGASSKPADFELKLRMFGGPAAASMIEQDTPEGTDAVAATPTPAAASGALPTPGSGLDFITQ
jgi:hypothetical protein